MNRRIESDRIKKPSRFSIMRRARSPRTPVGGDTSVVSSQQKSGERSRYSVSFLHLFFVVLSIVLATGGLVYHLHVRFESVRLGYEANYLRREHAKMMLERRKLRLELASVKEPGRIEEEAREKLQMTAPKAERIVTVGKQRRTVSVSGGTH